MARYFFHLASPDGLSQDDHGVELSSLEEAYLEGCKAALAIGFEMLGERRDPNLFRFEVSDETGRALIEIPFAEVLQPKRMTCPAIPIHALLNQQIARSRALRAELATALQEAKTRMEITRKRVASLPSIAALQMTVE